jgi:hypothetical protein
MDVVRWSCHVHSSWLRRAPRKRLSIPRENRKTMVKKYVVGVVVVHVVNHKVTRVLVENVVDMPDIVSIYGMEPVGVAMRPADEDDGISIVIPMVLEVHGFEKSRYPGVTKVVPMNAQEVLYHEFRYLGRCVDERHLIGIQPAYR